MPSRRAQACFSGVAFLLLTTGCGMMERLTYDARELCGEKAAALLKPVDWSQARVIEVIVSSGEFTPMVLNLEKHRAYRLIVSNRDATSRAFHAARFFRTSALAGLQKGSALSDDECIAMLVVAPGETVEARLMPLRRGRYDVAESYLPLGYWGSGLGVIYVN